MIDFRRVTAVLLLWMVAGVAAAQAPVLDLTMTYSGAAVQGQVGLSYTITASNISGAPTSLGTTLVLSTLPAGLTPTSASGAGWTCNVTGQALSCFRSDSIAVSASFPPITLTVDVSPTAPPSITTVATIYDAGGGYTTTVDSTTIAPAPPTVAAASPASGPEAGGTAVTLTGTNFTGATAVAFGATAAMGFTVISTTSIIATAPAGTGTVDVRVTTSGGTSATGAGDQYTYVAAAPVLDLTMTHSGAATAGQIGLSYTITASNTGGAPTSGALTVSSTLPAGLTPTSGSGGGWVCNIAGQALSCTRSDALASGASFPSITLTVNVSPVVPPSLTPSATVVGGGAASGATASDVTTFSGAAPPVVAARSGVNVPYNSAGFAIDLSGSITGGSHTSIAIGTAAAHGTTSIAGDVVTYTPTAGYYGADSFTYTATGPGGTSAPATVSLTVATPPAPVAASYLPIAVAYNSSGTAIDVSGAIAGVHTSIAVATAPAHGTTSVAGDVVTYTPTSGYFGTDSFTYTATGPGGTSSPGTVNLVVATPPAPTVAARAGITVPFNSAGTAIDLSGSITGVHTSIAVGTAPAHGTTSIAGDVVTYVPAAGYAGADSFTYTATGPGGTSAPATVGIDVAKETQAIAFANPGSQVFGTTLALAATASSGLPVTFGSATPGVCTASASGALVFVGAGTCTIDADQAGDASHLPAARVSRTFAVNAASQAITGFAANPATPTYAPNGTFAVSATPGASSSPLVFGSASPSICTVSGNTVTMLAAGACALTADQAGDANYTAAAQATLAVMIAAGTQTITEFAANPATLTYAPNGTFAVSATPGASSSPLVFGSTSPSVCTVNGSTATMLAAGTCVLTADQTGDANYTAAPQVVLAVAIGVATPVLGWGGPLSKMVGEADFELPLPTSTGPGGFTYASSDTAVATVSERRVTIVGPGTAVLTATQAATPNYAGASATIELAVSARPDPTRDAAVVASLQAQADMSVRFADTQRSNAQSRMRMLRSATGTPSQNGLALTMVGGRGSAFTVPLRASATERAAQPGRFGVWTAGSIVLGEQDGGVGAGGFDLRSDGISIGVDRQFGDFVLGAAVGAGWGDTNFADKRSQQNATDRSVMAYGLWRGDGHWYADGTLGWGRLDFDLARWSESADALATARRSGRQQFGAFSVGYMQQGKRADITGYGRIEAGRTRLDAYRESGLGAYDLAYRDQRIDSSALAAGVEGSHPFQWAGRAVRPFWSLEYRSALRDDGDGALNFVVSPLAEDYLLPLRSTGDSSWTFGAGVDIGFANGWRLSFSYQREQGDRTRSDGLMLRLVSGGAAPMLPAATAAPQLADTLWGPARPPVGSQVMPQTRR